MSQETPPTAAPRHTGLTIDQVFLDTVEFSHRSDALSLPPKTTIELGLLDVGFEMALSEDEAAGYLRVTIRTDPANQPLYSLRVSMTMLVRREGDPGKLTLQTYLADVAPATLYPFVREAVANLTQRGRFGPVWLKPLDITWLAQQAWQRTAAQDAHSTTEQAVAGQRKAIARMRAEKMRAQQAAMLLRDKQSSSKKK